MKKLLLLIALWAGSLKAQTNWLHVPKSFFPTLYSESWMTSTGEVLHVYLGGVNDSGTTVEFNRESLTDVFVTNVVVADNHKDAREWTDNYAVYLTDPNGHRHYDPYVPATQETRNCTVERVRTLRFKFDGDRVIESRATVTNWVETYALTFSTNRTWIKSEPENK